MGLCYCVTCDRHALATTDTAPSANLCSWPFALYCYVTRSTDAEARRRVEEQHFDDALADSEPDAEFARGHIPASLGVEPNAAKE